MIEIGWFTLLTSAISSTIILCLGKWRILELFEIHHQPICKFCLGFWLCLGQAIIIYFWINQNVFDLAIPFAGAAITRKLYE